MHYCALMAKTGKNDTEPSAYRHMVWGENEDDGADFSTSASRNTGPILDVLAGLLPPSGVAVEIASGTGQHAVAMATRFPAIRWTPSDRDPAARSSISAWVRRAGLENLDPPLDVDLTRPDWQLDLPKCGSIDAIVAFNVVHISPWETTLALLAGTAAALGEGGLLYIYGCFTRDGVQLSQSNIDFDKRLRGRNPAWGVRDTGDVVTAASPFGLKLAKIFEMPANNLSLAFRKPGHSSIDQD